MILNFILTNIALLPDENWLNSAVNLMLIFGLFMIINATFQSDNKVYFEEQGRIPLNDNMLAEKHCNAKNPIVKKTL